MEDGNEKGFSFQHGFSLYYGSIRGSAFKWLDLQRLARQLRAHDAIQSIKYFTALCCVSRRRA